jgi:cytochrome P450
MADMTVGGVSIPKGQMTLLCLGSANRDPGHFGPDADRLDVGRAAANEALSFGGGIHYCLGAALARLEGAVAIGSLVQRFPNVGLAEADWSSRIIFRGLDRLSVTLT